MNKENILSEAQKIFPDLSMIREDVYKGQLLIEDKTAGVYFLDLHGNITAKDFKEYQEEVLAAEYYDQESTLQWNLYFLLIVDEVNQADRQKIECDEKYARKYIFTEKEFLDFFTLDKNSTSVQSDIVTDWKKKLDAVDLPQVYGSGTYVDGVNNFISNRSVPSIVSRKKVSSDILRINFINKIILHTQFRPFPLIREFAFGKVNLFKGPNGVGKTSALEAVELIACGKTVRNPDVKEKDQCVEAIVNNTVREICTPANLEKYRSRDLDWYNNDYAGKNELYRSFNRFNFFDSDAANNFSKSNSETEVKQALERLILGSEFKYIKDRVNGFYTRLKPELNKLKGAISEAKDKIRNAESVLGKNQAQNTSVELLLNELRAKVKEVEFINDISLKDENLGELEIYIGRVMALIGRILSDNQIRGINNEELLAQQAELLKSRTQALENYRSKSTDLLKKIKDNKELSAMSKRRAGVLERVRVLLQKPSLLAIEGSGELLVSKQKELRKIDHVERDLIPFNYESFSDSKDIELVLSEGRTVIQGLQNEIIQINKEVEERLKTLGSVERITKEIRDKGKELLMLDEALENCPICDTHFLQGKLLERIQNLIAANSEKGNSVDSSDLTKSRMEKERMLGSLSAYVENVQKIQNIYQIIFERKTAKESLTEVVALIRDFHSTKPNLEGQIREIENLIALGSENGVSEESIKEVKILLASLFENSISLNADDSEKVTDALRRLELETGEFEEVGNQIQTDLNSLVDDLKSVLNLGQGDAIKIDDLSLVLKRDEASLSSLAKSFEELHQLIKFERNTVLDDVKSRLDEIQRNIASLRQAMTADHQVTQAKSDLDAGEKYLKQNEKYLERLEKGVGLLEELSNTGGESELANFFNANFKQILDVFKTIHAPREFLDLKYHNGEIDVIDENGELRRVSQISTGQRAALAISIFITMNRMLKNGPNLIIFDDPVSHVDDLNTLSFLDFLRIFILREKKQIFFSTANSRLASLFKKKFGFLGNDFREWDLKREPSEAVGSV